MFFFTIIPVWFDTEGHRHDKVKLELTTVNIDLCQDGFCEQVRWLSNTRKWQNNFFQIILEFMVSFDLRLYTVHMCIFGGQKDGGLVRVAYIHVFPMIWRSYPGVDNTGWKGRTKGLVWFFIFCWWKKNLRAYSSNEPKSLYPAVQMNESFCWEGIWLMKTINDKKRKTLEIS